MLDRHPKLYLPIKISEGQFSNEKAFTIEQPGLKIVSGFAYNGLIHYNNAGDTWLEVTLISKFKNGTSRILLAVELFETGSRYLDVDTSTLLEVYESAEL